MTSVLDFVDRLGLHAGGTASALEILLRVTMLLLAAMLVALALRRSSAALRHMVWTLSLGGALLIPFCYWALPGWQWAILPQRQQSPPPSIAPVATVAPVPAEAPLPSPHPRLPSPAPASESLEIPAMPPVPDGESFAATPPVIVKEPAPIADPPAPVAVRRTWSWPELLAVVWATGTSLGLLWIGIGVAGAWYVARRAQPAADSHWRQILQQLLAPCGFHRPIEIRQCPQVSVPMTWGVRRPVILVPAGSAAWSEEIKRSVLLHELGHIRRGDCLMHLLGRLACVAYWFHPLVWLAARQLRKTSEQAADDAVLSSNIAPPDYAEHLVGIAGQMRGLSMFSHVALPMANPSDLERRVLAILDPQRSHRSLKRKTCYALMLVAALLLIPCALLRLGYAQAAKDQAADSAAQDSEAKPAPAKNAVRVSGTVYQADGKPAVDARVWAAAVFVHPSLRQFTTTDANGQFHLELEPLSVPQSCWGVHARLADQGGDANDAYGHIDVSASRPTTSAVIRLEPRGELRGQVVAAETNGPIPNVRIFLDGGEVVTTDAQGCYEVGGLRFGDHTMILNSPGRLRKRVLFDTSLRKNARLDVALPEAGRIQGQVVDEEGKPVPGAWVNRPASGEALALNGFDEACDQQGRFVWDGVPFDQLFYGLNAEAPGYSSDGQMNLVVRKGKEPLNLLFHLRREKTPAPAASGAAASVVKPVIATLPLRDLNGVVRSPEGKPIQGALVRWGATDYEETHREARTDAEGRFELPQVPDRAGYVTVIDPKHAPHFLPVAKGETAVEVKLEHGPMVAGVVQTSSGRPLPGVQVVPVMQSPDHTLCNPFWLKERGTTTDAQGRFEIQELPNGLVRFDFMKIGSSELRNQALNLGSRDNVVKMYSTGAVRGIVVDPQGKPVRNFRIQIQIPRQRTPDTPCGGFDAGYESLGVSFSSDDGAFVVSGLTVDTFVRVVAIAPGYGQAVEDSHKAVPLNELPPAEELRLQLTESYNIKVYVSEKTDPGKPIADAAVTVITEDPSVDRRFSWGYHNLGGIRAYTQADGWATLADMPADETLVTIERPGYARQRLVWHKRRQDVKVQLEPEAVVTGTVTLKLGQPLSHYSVSLQCSEGDQYSVGIEPSDKGRFRFDQLPAGEYTLSIRDERNELYSEKLSLQTGATKELAVDVSPSKAGPKLAKTQTSAANLAMAVQAVAEGTGKPLANVSVEVEYFLANEKCYRKLHWTTNAEGKAILDVPDARKSEDFHIAVRPEGFVPQFYWWKPRESSSVFPKQLMLKFVRATKLGGQVLDESGEPVAGAKVTVMMPPTFAEKGGIFDLADVKTDNEGRWSANVGPKDLDQVSVFAAHPDYIEEAGQRASDSLKEGKYISRLRRGRTVAGHVSDAQGKPIQGATASVGLGMAGGFNTRATTDAKGYFKVGNCRSGSTIVTIQADGFAPQFEKLDLNEDVSSLTFTLEPGATIRGRVVDAQGNPVKNVGVAPDSWRDARTLDFRTKTDQEGRFAWNSAPRDTVVFNLFGAKGFMSNRDCPLVASDKEHTITLDPELVLRGTVVDEETGKPVEHIRVRLGRRSKGISEVGYDYGPNVERNDGRYELRVDEPTPGIYVKIEADGYESAVSREFKPTEGEQTCDFKLKKLKKAPSKSARDGAALMQAVYDGQAWINSVRSFHIRTEYKITPSKEGLQWEAKHPPMGFGGKRDPRPFCTKDEWAWDEGHILYRTQSHHEGETKFNQQTRVWDGAMAIECGQSPDHTSYVLGNKLTPFFDDQRVTYMALLPWGPGGAHHFWWLPTDVAKYRASQFIAPDDFELTGQEEVGGRRCYVVDSRAGHYRMHIGVDDHRLYRRTWFIARDGLAGYDRLALYRKIGGPSIKTARHWSVWLQSLKPDQCRRVWREFQVAEFEFARPVLVQTFDDYREASPGCWLPFRQTIDKYELESPDAFLTWHSEQIVTEATVNKPLPKDMFHIELVEGATVSTDWRYDPPIRYTYSKNQTEAERVALCMTARAKQEEGQKELKKREAVVHGLVGHAPPTLPASGWLDGKPLDWKQLQGKVVVVHFWEVNCGPCMNELPLVELWHERSAKSGIVVIGVHPPTDDLAAVRKKMADLGAKYPVLIDSPAAKPGGLGLMHDGFGISLWPYTVLINKKGLVAGHGRLWGGDIAEQVGRLLGEDLSENAAGSSTDSHPAPKASPDNRAKAPAEPPPALLTAFGKVVDPAGKPVAGATVHLREWSTYRISQEPYNENLNDVLATTRTDAEGAFQFKSVPAKPLHDQWLREIPWDVVVVAKPYSLAWRHLDAAQQFKPLKIALAPEAKITGQVKDKQGRPIQNAEVRAISISSLTGDLFSPRADPETLDLQFSHLAPAAKTDADGKVTVAGLPRELLLTFVVTHDDFRREIVRVATTDQPQADIDVPGRGIEGKMPPMEAAKVYAGAFSIALGPPLPRVVGRILAADSKKPLTQTRVDLYGGLGTMTDRDGRFTIREIRDQPCRLLVFAPQGGQYLGRLVHVDVAKAKRETQIDVELPRGETLSGIVVDEKTGKGVAGVALFFDNGFDVNKSPTDGPLPSYGNKTDSAGRFQLAVPPGKGKLKIFGPVQGYDLPSNVYTPPGEEANEDDSDFVKNITVVEGKPSGDVKFAVRRGAASGPQPLVRPGTARARTGRKTVEGVVTDPDGKPVAGAQVSFSHSFSVVRGEQRPVQTDQNGRFSLRIDSGPYPRGPLLEMIVAIHNDRKLRGHVSVPDSDDKAAKTPIEIRLLRTGTVTGRVLEGDKPIAGVLVNLIESKPAPGSRTMTFSDNARTDQDGRFEFPLVEAGKQFDLSIMAERYAEAEERSNRVQVQVAAGGTFEVKPFSMIRLDKSVAGVVVDPDGNPVAGAVISARFRSGQSIPYAFTKRPTGKDGRFAIRGVPNVPLSLMAYMEPSPDSKDRSIRFTATVDAEAGQTDVQIVLDPKLVRKKK